MATTKKAAKKVAKKVAKKKAAVTAVKAVPQKKDIRAAVTECFNPATGELIGTSPLNTPEDVKKAIMTARQVQPAWAALPVRERVKYIRRVRDYVVAHAGEIAETISRDNGKDRIDALMAEVLTAAMGSSYYMKKAKCFLKDQKLGTGNIMTINKRSTICRIPFGVIGIISPWNYPFAIPFAEIIMALLAGNAVILKVASETQMVGRAIEDCLRAADLPEGLFTHVNLPGSVAGAAFLDHGVDKLFFTGSVPTGKWLMARAAETLTPVVLELGGNDAMLVCEDADITRAVYGAVWAGLSNSGQSCAGVERIYVHEKIYDAYMARLKDVVDNFRVGYDTDFNVDMGCMTTKKQIETVRFHVADALKKGAKIFAQSPVPSDKNLQNFLPAMVITDVNHDMLLMRDETFGPVVGVMKVKNMDEAVELANDSNLGLTGSVWSKNMGKAKKLARRVRAGAVTVNDHLMSHGLAETQWGGFKETGIGRTHGKLGFDEMTEPLVVVNDILFFIHKDLWWHPYSKKVYEGILGIIEVLYGKGIITRLKGLGKMMKIVPRYFEK